MLAPNLRETLVMVAAAMRDAQDPWWVISSAAVALHGVGPVEVGDVDVVMSVSDARRLMASLGVTPIEDGVSSLFRSTLFGGWETPVGRRDHGGVLCCDGGWVDGGSASDACACPCRGGRRLRA
jgi:hypothetical protein